MEASAINQPHPDDSAEEDFFGDAPADPDPSTFDPESGTFPAPAQTPPPGPSDPAAEAAAYREEKGEPQPAAAEPAQDDAPPAPEGEKQSGSLEREYIVFQKLALTEKVLKHLLDRIGSGDAPKPRIAYVELHRATTRTDKQAIGQAHAANRQALGEVCDLAAVSARSFKERHVEPQTIPAERRLVIT